MVPLINTPSIAPPTSKTTAKEAAKDGLEANFRRFLSFVGVKEDESIELCAFTKPDEYRHVTYPRTSIEAVNRLKMAEGVDKTPSYGVRISGLYVVPNQVHPGVALRYPQADAVEGASWREVWPSASKSAGRVGDNDVTRRRILLIDIDTKGGKPSGVSSTNEEKKGTLAVAKALHQKLIELVGESCLAFADSGNGYQVLIATDLPNDEEHAKLSQKVLACLHRLFSCDAAIVDQSTHNASRLIPAYGTMKAKGEASADRPARRTWIATPDRVTRLGSDEFKRLVLDLEALAPEEKKESKRAATSSQGLNGTAYAPEWDEFWRQVSDTSVTSVLQWLGLYDRGQATCPSCGEHDGSSVSTLENKGTNLLKCLHAKCSDKGIGEGRFGAIDIVIEARALHNHEKPRFEAARLIAERFAIPMPKSRREKRDDRSDELEALEQSVLRELGDVITTPKKAAPVVTDEEAIEALMSAGCAPAQVEIRLGADVHRVLEAAEQALANDNDVYYRGRELVTITNGAVSELPLSVLKERHLSRVATFLAAKPRKDGLEWIPVGPPKDTAKALHEAGYWPGLRELKGFIDTPCFRADGTILAEDGYDKASKLYLRSSVKVTGIPNSPTKDDAKQALGRILSLVEDFPFASPLSRTAWFSALVSVIARPMIDGPLPGLILDANNRRVGKGLLANVLMLICQSGTPAVHPFAVSPEEVRKSVLGILKEGRRINIIDDAPQGVSLGNHVWNALLTSREYTDRELGTSTTQTLPNEALWGWTANNIQLSGDITARVIHCRLLTDQDNPEKRTGFKIPNLIAHVRENRAEIIRDLLTIVSAWIEAGKPDGDKVILGGFAEWAAVVGGICVWLGLGDPTKTQEEYAARTTAGEGDAGPLRQLMLAWGEAFGTEGKTAAEVIRLISEEDARTKLDGGAGHRYETLREAILEFGGGRWGVHLPGAKGFGKALAGALERPVKGMQFLAEKDPHLNAQRWTLKGWTAPVSSDEEYELDI